MDFKKTYDALFTTSDLKDTMVDGLPPFLTRLHNIKKLCKAEKYEERIREAFNYRATETIKSRATETLKLLKAIMLVRHVDRSIREKSIRAIKQLLKLCPEINS